MIQGAEGILSSRARGRDIIIKGARKKDSSCDKGKENMFHEKNNNNNCHKKSF